MLLRRIWFFGIAVALMALPGVSVRAQLIVGGESLIDKYNPFRQVDPSEPVSVIDLSKRLDCISEKLRYDGLVAIKQPDVFSQARMTHFRTDFENMMHNDLTMFHLVLAARINRLDAATTTQSTNLSAALSAPGTAHVQTGAAASTSTAMGAGGPPPPPGMPSGGAVAPGTSSGFDPNKNSFTNLGLDASNPAAALAMANSAAALSLGVEPTVYLDEKKRFLEHLNQIRRINHGPDQNDSSGYGLYLVRLPVSITPGECTYHGHGAELALTVKHEFPNDFLQTSFRNFVVNDLVDQLGPVVYEVIRSGLIDKLKDFHDLEVRRAIYGDKLDNLVNKQVTNIIDLYKNKGQAPAVTYDVSDKVDTDALAKFILRDPNDYPVDTPSERQTTLEQRSDALKHAVASLARPAGHLDASHVSSLVNSMDEITSRTRLGGPTAEKDLEHVKRFINSFLVAVARSGIADKRTASEAFKQFYVALLKNAFNDDVALVAKLVNDNQQLSKDILAQSRSQNEISRDLQRLKLSLPSTRNPKERYPIAPQEVLQFFLEENIYVLAREAKDSSLSKIPHLTDVRNFLKHTLYVAYDIMAKAMPNTGDLAPLNNVGLMDEIRQGVEARDFGLNGKLEKSFQKLVDEISRNRKNIYNKRDRSYPTVTALCWAIAVDAGLFDASLREWIPKVFKAHDVEFAIPDDLHFYVQDEARLSMAGPIFNDFVKYRWPIITFALDPVTDQQNVADSYTLQRDLQLALSFAFATGQINFSQMNTFRRQLQQSSDTIALNRTVTGFIHDNDNFGFRFTPRFQNPPNQRTNIGVIASQLIGGGPGPDYQTRKSKLEPGIRELTAVLLLPTFLPTMRMEVSSNWFKLTDPEHLIFHTKRMLERGREVQELRRAIVDACGLEQYRVADLNVLQAKLSQLEAMLPSQSKVIQLPYENTACGFDLYTDGATALVPELSGYEGIDIITKPAAGTSTSMADIFIYGKYIDLLDTKVIVGGSYLPPATIATATTGGFEILSREVVHAQIPLTAQPTVTVDNKTYLEVYLATPTGISNRLLVPFQAAAAAPQVAFDLSPDTPELDVYYQWWPKADPTATLVATSDPGAGALKIKWDASTGMAPKTLQATFSTTILGQSLSFSLEANSGVQDEYVVNTQLMTVMLLKRLQGLFPAPTPLPAQISMKISVQPYLPQNSMGYRVLSKAKDLNTPLTVKLFYNSNGTNALKGIIEQPPVPTAAPAAKKAAARDMGERNDDPMRRVSLTEADLGALSQVPGELQPQLNALITSPVPPAAGELAGSLSQAASSAVSSGRTVGNDLVTQASNAIPSPAQVQAQVSQLPQSIVVHSSPVTVVAPTTVMPPKSHSILSRLLHRNRGNAPAAGGSSR